MDQHTPHDVLQVGSADGRSDEGRPGGAALPVLLRLAASLIAIVVLAVCLAAVVAGSFVLGQIMTLGLDETHSFYLSLRFNYRLQARLTTLAVTVLYLSLAGATLTFARLNARETWRDVVALRRVGAGWRRNASIAVMVLIYAALASLALAMLRERHMPIEGPTDTVLLGLLMTNLVIFAPAVEELFFRGWLYTGLRRRFGFGTTLFATALLFAAFHWEPRRMILVLPLAFALGFIREQTGSIAPTIALHAFYNLVIVVIALAMA